MLAESKVSNYVAKESKWIVLDPKDTAFHINLKLAKE